MMRRLGAFAAPVFLLWAVAASAEERITDYASDIVVAKNGALTVTETISVVSEGYQIRHGIFRDFPTTYTDKLGRRVHVDFNVLSVMRDGQPENYDLDSIADGERVKIGNADVNLDPGPHVFKLVYSTDRQIGFFAYYDELYWNVTGNFWEFPIDHAEATIHLPAGASIRQFAYYTGSAGATDHNASANEISANEIAFATTAPLGPNEGLTVAVGFSKGAVLPPTAAELRAQFIRDNASAVAAWAGIAILLVYFTVVWFEYGRDPRRGTIVPLFAPPNGFSPAAVRYVHRMAYDRKSYAASLVDMAVKGYLTISEKDHTYTLIRTGKSNVDADLAHGENAMADKLFAGSDTLEMKQANHSAIQGSIFALQLSLKREYERVYFVTNVHWFLGGLAILAVTAGATALLCDNASTAGFLLLWLSGWSVGTAFLIHRVIDGWRGVFYGPGSRAANFANALFFTLFALPFTGGLVGALFVLGSLVPVAAMIALMVGGGASYLFHYLLKAPTLLGAKIFDEIDGFRMFLDTAEKDRLEVLNPPDVTPAVFEKYLPYAMALDCENRWSKKFEDASAAAGVATSTAYVPIWYSGNSFANLGAAGFASALGSSMASAAAAAATPPGSSSGSGGGGFSGGGGGGGGGGGW
jgi:uncharacterized membrane protein YgcG